MVVDQIKYILIKSEHVSQMLGSTPILIKEMQIQSLGIWLSKFGEVANKMNGRPRQSLLLKSENCNNSPCRTAETGNCPTSLEIGNRRLMYEHLMQSSSAELPPKSGSRRNL